MLPFLDSFVSLALATLLPALAGLSLMILVGGLTSARYSAAFALGVFLWFFVDTLQGSSDLLVNAGFAGGTDQALMVALFVAGVALFFWADGRLFSPNGSYSGLLVPLLVALALGLHGFGEGSAVGSTAAQTSSSSLLDAFGGVGEGIAYALHKVLEPMMVGAVYLASSKSAQGRASGTVRDTILLAVAFSLPSLAGCAAGYFVSYNATYFFALGAGASVFVAFELFHQVFTQGSGPRGESLKAALAFLLGFILIYLAALLHA